MTEKQRTRKEKALVRLEAQIKSGVKRVSTKTVKSVDNLNFGDTVVPLSDKDKIRIQREIDILKQRL